MSHSAHTRRRAAKNEPRHPDQTGPLGFEATQPHLVSDISPFADQFSPLAEEAVLAGHRANVRRLGKRGGDLPQAVGWNLGGDIRKHQDVGACCGDGAALRVLLAEPDLGADQRHAVLGEAAHNVIGAVVRTIRGDDDLQQLPWIVDGQRVVELPRDAACLVVRRDDQRHARQCRDG